MIKPALLVAALTLSSIAAASACTTEADLRELIAKDGAHKFTVEIRTGDALDGYRNSYNRAANLHNKTKGKTYFVKKAAKLMLVYPKSFPSRVFLHTFKADGCEFWRGYIPTVHHKEVLAGIPN